jgi:hypothetical protein
MSAAKPAWKALSIHQPWASLIVAGRKRVENRTWWPAFRGPILIHASRTTVDLPRDFPDRAPADCPTGVLLGVAVLVDVVGFDPETETVSDETAARWPWLATDPYSFGPWCWVLQHARPLPVPVPIRGCQGLWNVDPAQTTPTLRDFLADYLDVLGTESAPCPPTPRPSRPSRARSPRPATGSSSSPAANSD